MCGICGVLDNHTSRAIDVEALVRMRDAMTHRGPDDAGLYVDGPVGLGARRLSIIDVSGGHQPIPNEDEAIWAVCNGEIYNFAEVRRDLIARGHRFRTRTDTEVIVHLYEELGPDFVHKLEGMFGIALWDKRKQRLVLARDRLGIKPLYYTLRDGLLLFASEIKAILQWPEVLRECNREALGEFLAFRYVAGPATLFKGIFSLLPGHLLLANRSGIRVERYWQVGTNKEENIRGNTEGELGERLAGLLEDAVRSHLVSDVPLGTLSSGGLDSSALTAYAVRLHGRALNTFSVGFDETRYNELPYARLISQRYQTDHHEICVSDEMFAETLPKLLWFNDAPLDQPNSVPIYLICKLAKKTVTVLLTGEGSDELFAGYPRYFIPYLYRYYKHLPGPLQAIARWTAGHLNTRRFQKLREALTLTPQEVIIQNSAYTRFGIIEDLCIENPQFLSSGRLEYLDGVGLGGSNNGLDLDMEGFVENLLRYEQQTYLVSLLERQDKMSMAASIESRVPFLDRRVVEFANSLPLSLKIKRMDTKHLLKVATRGIVPEEIIQKKKWGFGVPIGAWFRNQHGMGRYLEVLRDRRFRERGYFRQEVAERLMQQHLSGVADHGEILWVLINLELWHQTFLDAPVQTPRVGAYAL